VRTKKNRSWRTWIERLLATGVAIVLALQPVVRAGTCSAPGEASSGRHCCCSAESTKSCCELPEPHRDSRGPTVRRESCGCALRAPIAPLALPGTADPREVKSNASAWTQHWIADGARASGATPIPSIAFGPDPPGDPVTSIDSARTSEDSPRTVVCARGIHAQLAFFGTLLR
jgi:hypothetical protein